MRPFTPGTLSVCLLLFSGGHAVGQGLADPTRPSELHEGDRATVNAAASGEPVLQAVVLERNRKYAVISGQIVRLGDRFAGAQLVQIGESEVVLRTGRDVKKLKLVPGVDKKPARATTRTKEGLR